MKVLSILIVLFITVSSMWSYPWSIRDFQGPHQINATLGDYRQTGVNPRFHNGVDIQASESTKVYSIVSDTVRYVTDGVRVGNYTYIHLMDRYDDDTYIEGIIDSTAPLDSIGITDDENHVHFMEGPAGGPYQNPLRNGGLDNYTDNNGPTIIAAPQFFPQGEELTTNRDPLHTDTLYEKVDIRVRMRDFANTGQGSGIYKCSYTIADTLDSIYYNSGTTIIFDQVSPPSNGTPVVYVYDTTVTEHANSATFHYWATNPIVSNQVVDRYWNTKQQAGQPDSVDADSIEVAKFKDGFYWVKVYAYDIKNNADSESVYVHVDNFNPRVKESKPTKWFAFVPNKQKTIWFKFSEAMDTTTLNTTNITIQSLKSDSFSYPIVDITYIDSTYELTLEVDSFRFKDTVQVRFSDSVTDLAGKSIESGLKDKGIAYTLTFVVSVKQLTDNDLWDLYPDVYHGKIVWTQAPAGTDLGEIMLYDFYNDTTYQISPGGGIHTTPYIYSNDVAWIGWQGSESEYVYYYDGNTSQQVTPANRGRYSMEISEGGVVWRSYKTHTDTYDSIWVEYYSSSTDSVYTLDLFLEEYGRYYGSSDIDGEEIVWDRIENNDREVYYYYSGTTENFSSDTSRIDGTPDISYGQIVWLKQDGVRDVWYYDGTNKREIDNVVAWAPHLHNGSITWVYGINMPGSWDLKFFDGRDTLILMNNNSGWSNNAYSSINIHNNQVSWVRLVREKDFWEGFFNASYYDGENVLHLTDDTLSKSWRIELHDGFVVYDAWDGNDYEIYLYVGDTLFTPPAVVSNLQGEILSASEKRVRLTWSPSSEPDLAGYNIYRSNMAYQFDTIPYTMVSAAETTFIDTLPIMGMNYYVATAFDNTSNEGGFSNQVEAYIDTTPPIPPLNLAAAYDSVNQFVFLIWNTSTNGDLNLYRIYRSEISGTYTTPLDSVFVPDTTFVDSTIFLGKTYYYVVSAVDTNNNESGFSNEDSVFVPGIIFSDFSLATAYNNASRIIRNPSTDELLLAYTSDDSIILCTSSSDEGITWNRSKTIGTGTFPTLTLDSGNNPCCLFGRWIGPSGYGSAQLYYTKYINNHWTTPFLLMSVDSVYIGVPRYAIPAPSVSIDSQDTIHVTWMSPMGQEYLWRFAVWYGNFYAFDTMPIFNYIQLDTILVEGSPCPTLAIDEQENIHVVYEDDPAAPTLFYRYRESGIWVEKETIESDGCYYPDLEFFGERVHLVWDYRYPDTTVAHELHYRSKSTTGWDTIMNIYEPLPFNVFGEPVNAGGWYTIWADQDIYYSRFDGTTWQEPESVQVTPLLSAHPTAMFRQDLDDTCLYIAWTEGDSAPYTIQFKKIAVPSVPRSYANLGQPVQSPYCLERDGYWIFGDKPYESVDYDNDSLVYRFSDLDPAKEYRLDLAYYFEPNPRRYSPPPLSSPFKGEGIIDCTSLIKGSGMSEKVSATNHCSDLKCPTDEIISPPAADHSDHAGDESEKGIGRLIQALVIDGVKLDSAFIVPHKLVRVSIWLPNELYADGEIITEIEKIKGKVVVCGEIALYEFSGEEEKGSIANMLGGPQSNETMHVNSILFQGLYPNPAKGDLKVKFNSPDEREVTVKLYDVTGRLINEIFNGKLKIGTNEIPIRSKKLAAGVYFIRIEVGKDIITVKVVMLK